MSKPTVELGFDKIRIRFDGVLHLALVRSKLLGVHAWRYGDRNYTIEYTMTGGNITCEYDEETKSRAILEQLDDVF